MTNEKTQLLHSHVLLYGISIQTGYPSTLPLYTVNLSISDNWFMDILDTKRFEPFSFFFSSSHLSRNSSLWMTPERGSGGTMRSTVRGIRRDGEKRGEEMRESSKR